MIDSEKIKVDMYFIEKYFKGEINMDEVVNEFDNAIREAIFGYAIKYGSDISYLEEEFIE